MELQVGVKILIKDRQGRALLLRRNSQKYPEAAGRWDIVGGRINTGTLLGENLKREVMEETGLELREEPKLVGAQDILRVPGRHVVRLTYVGFVKPGEIKLDESENDMYKWFTRKEMDELEKLDIYVKELLDKGLI